MNRIYNIIWSKAKEKWIVVSERVKSNGGVPKSPLPSIALLTAMMATGAPAYGIDPSALPTGGQVSSGTAAISYSGNHMSVNQSTNQMVANWDTFNIGQNAGVTFYQPGTSAVALNRITDVNPSQIMGSLNSNGMVFLVNPSGVLFGNSARVDVGGLVTSTLGISDSQFLGGNYTFSGVGNTGSIINSGSITARNGVVALIAPVVSNTASGSIATPGGTTAIGAGEQVAVDFAGDGLVSLRVDKGVVNALANNSGLISADGGRVVMTAKSAADIATSVVNNSGVISAQSMQQQGGRIILDGTNGLTTVSGTLNASSPDGVGGTVVVAGDKVAVQSGAQLNASGLNGGGSVLVGGGWSAADGYTAASGTLVEQGAVLQANAAGAGNGGRIVALSDLSNPSGVTLAQGRFEANAGPLGGNGGFVETSGTVLDTNNISVSAAGSGNGAAGTWLLDPTGVTIANQSGSAVSYAASGAAVFTPASSVSSVSSEGISAALGTGTNVTVSTAGTSGDIVTAAAITKAGGNAATLSLQAGGNVLVGGDITGNRSTLNIDLSSANRAGATTGGVNVDGNLASNGGSITIGGGAGGYALNAGAGEAAVDIETGRSIVSNGGNISIKGMSVAGEQSGQASGEAAGVHVDSGVTILSGAGNLAMTGLSTGGSKTYGVSIDSSKEEQTTIGSGIAGGTVLINAGNSAEKGATLGIDGGDEHSSTTTFVAPTVAAIRVQLNDKTQQLAFNANSADGYRSDEHHDDGHHDKGNDSQGYNGQVNIPGGSHDDGLVANYTVGTSATKAIIVETGDGSKVYDGTTVATGLDVNVVGGRKTDYTADQLVFRTPSKNVGTGYSVTLDSDNNAPLSKEYAVGYYTGNYTITPKTVTVQNLLAYNKVYNGNTDATIATSGASIDGLIAGDDVAIDASGRFSDKNVGVDNTVYLTTNFSGEDRNNYIINGPESTTASITPKTISLLGISAEDKVYDGTTAASVSAAGARFDGMIEGDQLVVSNVSGSFGDKNVGTDKRVGLNASFDGADLGNYNIIGQNSTTADITPKTISVNGISAESKVYDGTTNARVSTSGVQYDGVIAGDDLQVNSISGRFADKNAGNDKNVSLNATFGGEDRGNYKIVEQVATTADIYRKAMSVSGISAENKIYDGTTAASVSASEVRMDGIVAGDKVTVASSGLFTDKNAANGKTVNLRSSFTGEDAGNYDITAQSTTTADIYRKDLTVSGITASDKIYDGNTAASVSTTTAQLSGLVRGDNLTVSSTGAFDNKNVGSNKLVALSSNYGGQDVNNYNITSQQSTRASVTPKDLTVSGITAADKVYDRTTAATVSTANVNLAGLVAGDNVTVASTGAFADKNAGQNKLVNLSSNYGGIDAGNYRIAGQTTTTATITPKEVIISGITAKDKGYDGNTSATVNTSGVQFDGWIPGDDLYVSAAANFQTPDAGVDKVVDLTTNYGGLDLGNYSIVTQPTAVATITPVQTTPPPPPEVPAAPIPPVEVPTAPPVVEPTPAPVVDPTPTPVVEPTPAPAPEPIPVVEPTPAPAPEPVPVVEPTPAPVVETAAPAITSAAGLMVQYVAAPTTQVTETGTVQIEGRIDVTVPETTLTTGGGATFTIPLPDEVSAAAVEGGEVATLDNGEPLPSWVTYDSANKVFKATSVTSGDLTSTVTVKLRIGTKSWKVVISAQK